MKIYHLRTKDSPLANIVMNSERILYFLTGVVLLILLKYLLT